MGIRGKLCRASNFYWTICFLGRWIRICSCPTKFPWAFRDSQKSKTFNTIISFYYSIGFYTGWLLPAALVGLLVFLYGIVTIESNTVAHEICNSGQNITMCPLCDNCSYWKLGEICAYAKVSYLFDHPGTVFYAVFVSFWGKSQQVITLKIDIVPM